MAFTLYDYWRSSAAYRVRIALNLKGLSYTSVPVNLLEGEQAAPAHKARNPQGLVPALAIDGENGPLAQSLAIIDYLDSLAAPRLIPEAPLERARALSAALIIVADVHPLANLRVLKYLKAHFGADQPAINAWIVHWIGEGLAALETQAPESGFFGGDRPNVVDVVLIPQLYNARRFDVPLDACPKLVRIDAACAALPAFADAHPDRVKP